MSNSETVTNPFEEEQTSQAYKKADPVYEKSAQAAVEFVSPKDYLSSDDAIVLDIGGGTGVSAEIILGAGAKNLYLIDPSKAMIDQAHERLGDKVQYINSAAEELIDHFDNNVELAYSLNAFHLFSDVSKFLANIACILKPGAVFVFNISAPTYGFDEISEQERKVIEANHRFYTRLNDKLPNEILAYTANLLGNILETNYENIYTKDKVEMVFGSVQMKLEDDTEIVIKVPADYQRNIWSMVSKSFTQDEALVSEIIDSIELPEEIEIRQAIFKLVREG